MHITQIHITRAGKEKAPVMGYVEMTIDDSVLLRNMLLVGNPDDDMTPRLRMPARMNQNGQYRDLYNPINNETRTRMTEAVMSVYNRLTETGVSEITVDFDAEKTSPVFSDVQMIRLEQNDGPLLALASCLLDDSIVLRRIGVVLDEETKMPRITTPNRKRANGRWSRMYRFTSPETIRTVHSLIMAEFGNSQAKSKAVVPA